MAVTDCSFAVLLIVLFKETYNYYRYIRIILAECSVESAEEENPVYSNVLPHRPTAHKGKFSITAVG